MKSNEIIESGILESYVLGIASEEEVKLVNAACHEFPEVLSEVEAIEQALVASLASHEVQPGSMQKVLKQIEENKENNSVPGEDTAIKKLPSAATPASPRRSYRLAVAAMVALLIASAVINVLLLNRLGEANTALAGANAEKNNSIRQANAQQTALAEAQQLLSRLSSPSSKKIVLKGSDLSPASSAVVYWDQNKKEVYLSVAGLPAPAKGKQYQLWALVGDKKIDAGVFDAQPGRLQKLKSVEAADGFAVTLENEGGSESPTLSALFLVGII